MKYIFTLTLLLMTTSLTGAQGVDFTQTEQSSVAAKMPVASETEPPFRQNQAYVRPNAEKRFKKFASDTFRPFALLGNAAGAGFSTLANEPEEWGKNWEGLDVGLRRTWDEM